MPLPLPLLFIIPIAATGVFGAGKGIKAGVDIKDAQNTNAQANEILESAKKSLEMHRSACSIALNDLGSKKLFILDKSINKFVSVVDSLKNVELKRTKGLNELNKFVVDKKSFFRLKEMGNYASSILSGATAGALSGALTAFGAWSAAGAFAQASTGIGISALSGAAATNATLAFFGGGSLAVGGLGVAGGTVILGGLVAGPALAVIGLIVGAKAKTQKEKAYQNLAEAKKIAEELKTAQVLCDGIRRRCNMFYNLLIQLDALFTPFIIQTEQAVLQHNGDYKKFSTRQKNIVAATFSLAGSIKAILDTAILTENGDLTEESATLVPQVSTQIKKAKQPQKQIALRVISKNVCPFCKNKLKTGTKFCDQCGTKL